MKLEPLTDHSWTPNMLHSPWRLLKAAQRCGAACSLQGEVPPHNNWPYVQGYPRDTLSSFTLKCIFAGIINFMTT